MGALRLSDLVKPLLALTILLVLWFTRQPLLEFMAQAGDQEAVTGKLRAFGLWGPLFLALFQFIQVMVAVIPGHALFVAAGYMYGFAGGFGLTLLTTVLSSQLAFALARRAGGSLAARLAPSQALEKYLGPASRYGFAFFMIGFMLPLFPADLLNLVAGLSPISAKRFLLASLLGRLPGVAVLTLIGSHGLELPLEVWALIVAVMASMIVVVHTGLPRHLHRRPT